MKRLFVTSVLCIGYILAVQAQTWNGSVNNDWNNPNNWNPTAVPGSSSNVIIPGTVSSGRWPQFTSDVSINTLSTNIGSQLDVNGFMLTLATSNAHNNLLGITVHNSNPVNPIVINIAGGTGGYSTAFLRNTFNGNLVLNISGYFYEGNVGAPDNSSASTYNGNTTININASVAIGISNTNYSTFNGNLSINRTAKGTLDAFGSGGIINGNFSFTDIGGGNTILGNTAYRNIPVTGTININAQYIDYNDFSLHRFANQTPGGSINIQHVGVFNITRDTLKVNELSITNFATNYGYITANQLYGNLIVTDNASNSYPTTIRNNSIYGNSNFTNNGSGTFWEADQPGNANRFYGNTLFTANGGGTLNISGVSNSIFDGNLSIIRNAAGITAAFGGGADITGNFSFINNTSGNTTLGNKNIRSTYITGTINLAANYNAGSTFFIYRLVNQTAGGNINIQNTTGFDLYKDTLKLEQLSITGYKDGFGYLQNNKITGNINIADHAANGNNYYTYLRSNEITGNAVFTCNGTNAFMDADVVGGINRYFGNVTYAKGNTGAINIGSGDTTIISGNLTLNSTVAISLTKIKFVGANNSTFEQQGTQTMIWIELIMQKTSAEYHLTLLDSISMAGKLTFITGNIISDNGRELIFSKTGTSNGASDQSHAVGPVVKLGNAAFSFPTGSLTALQAVAMTAPATNLDRYRCEYKFVSPHPTYDTSLHAPTILAMGNCEYWDFRQEAGTSSLKLTFDFGNPCGEVFYPNALKVARWTGSQWEDLGNSGYTGSPLGGTVSISNNISNFGIFTLASSAVVMPDILIARSTPNPVCACTKVAFYISQTSMAGNNPIYQWKKNNIAVGTNSETYIDSTLKSDDAIRCLLISSIQFAYPQPASSNVFFITAITANTWTGTQSTNWFDAGNWSCNVVPCELTDVIIDAGTPHTPTIATGTANCKSILLKTNATLLVAPNAKLNVKTQQ